MLAKLFNEPDYRLMMESIIDTEIITLDVNGNVCSWNKGAENLKGYSAAEVMGRHISMFYTPEDIENDLASHELATAAETGRFQFEGWRVGKGDAKFWADIVLQPIKDSRGEVTGYIKLVRDMTERKYSEDKFRAAVEFAPTAMVMISSSGEIMLINGQTEKLFGYRREELIGKAVEVLLPAAMRSRHPSLRDGFFVDPAPRMMGGGGADLCGLHKDGQEVPVEIALNNITTIEGNFVLAAITDISERKRFGAKISEITAEADASQYARSLIEASLDPLVTISPEGIITDVNEGSINVTGVAREDLIGTDFSNYFTEPDKARAGYQLAFDKGLVTDYPLTVRHVDGKLTDVLYNASVYRDADGNVLGVFAAARDVTAQKQASQYARSLIEASLDPLVTISPEGKITDVNEGSINVTGVAREKLIGTDFSNYFTEPDKARAGYQEAFNKGTVTDYPLTVRHVDGKLTDVLYNASVYRDADGNVLGVFAAARDVTAQKQVSQYARSLIEASLDPLVTISPEGKITDVNDGSIKVTGVAREELIGTDFSNYFTEPDKARAGYQEAFNKGTVTDYPLTVRHVDGKLSDVLYNASVYRDADGNVLGVFAAARDVTAQKQASQYARSLIEASLDPLVTISPEGKITDVNEGSIKVTGVAREELIGTDFSNYFTEPDNARAGYQEAFNKGSVTDYPLTVRHIDGKLTDVLYNASVYRGTSGKVLGVFAAARDVTAQKQAEAELAERRVKEMERLAELERFQKLTVGRELKMIELKAEIAELKRQLPPEAVDGL
ncbi:PAS domain S-box protein [Zhongshania arctica]|uniref:histidine kinase n=1 Tax=Zhongshania arctica TaxID=3238302 RepID=A0ABV3TX29_9GAMM